jgi:hypothetical protein
VEGTATSGEGEENTIAVVGFSDNDDEGGGDADGVLGSGADTGVDISGGNDKECGGRDRSDIEGGCGLLAVTRVEAKTKATGTSSVDPRAFSQKIAETEASGWYCGWKVSEVAGMLWPAEALASAAVAMVSVVEDTLVKPSVEITLIASVVVPPPGLGPNAWLIPFRHVTSRDVQM